MTSKLRNLSFNQVAILKELRFHTSLRSLCSKLNLSNSNISRDLNEISELLDRDLLVTSSKGYILTEDGLKLSELSESVWSRAEELFNLAPSQENNLPLLTIGGRGYINLLATKVLTPSEKILQSTRLRFLDLSPNEMMELALLGVVDCLVHFEEFDLPQSWHTQTLIAEVPWKIHASQKHFLSNDATLAEVLKVPFVVPSVWTGREITTIDDGFSVPWSQRVRGLEAQTALLALQIVENSDQIAFLPEIFSGFSGVDRIKTLAIKDQAILTKDLKVSVHSSRVSLKVLNQISQAFNLYSLKFKQEETNESTKSKKMRSHAELYHQ